MNSSDIASVMGVNDPVAIDATPEVVNATRIAASQQQTVTLSDGSTHTIGKQQPTTYWRLGKAGLEALFGFRVAKQGEIARFFTKAGNERLGYVADWNHSNRPHIKSNHELLSKAIHGGKYVTTPEVWIFLDDGQCGSAQHRGWAHYEKCLNDASHHVVANVSMGFSALLADVLDRAAKRTNKDIIVRNNLIDDELFMRDGISKDGTAIREPIVPDVSSVIATLSREMNSVAKIVELRATGRDIKASGAFDAAKMGSMLDRMPGLPTLMRDVYVLGKDATGKDTVGVTMFGRSNIVAALILASNLDNPAEILLTEKGKRDYVLPDEIHLPDDDLVEGFLEVLGRSDAQSEFAEVFAKWKGASNKHPQRKFGVLVGLVEQFLASRQQDEVPAPIDQTTGQPLPGSEGSTRWVCTPVSFGKIDPGAPKGRIPGTTPEVYRWSAFGGLDTGYLDPVK